LAHLEDIVLSPFFAITLGIVGSYLFVILTREFFLWYSKINQIEAKLATIEEKLDELNLVRTAPHAPPKLEKLEENISSRSEQQFPLSH